MNKRQFLKSIGLFTAGTTILGIGNASASTTEAMPYTIDNMASVGNAFTLAPLPYAYDALESYIDKLTMEIHHDRHHKAYVDNLNKEITATNATYATVEDILKKINKKTSPILRNNAGGHWNHTFFWESMSATHTQSMGTATTAAIVASFGTIDAFKEAFAKAALGRFGSGWAWLCKNKKGALYITSTPNQDNPLMHKVVEQPGIPLLGIDVWEHAYYLKYQNKRADYIKAWWSVVNWAKVEKRLG